MDSEVPGAATCSGVPVNLEMRPRTCVGGVVDGLLPPVNPFEGWMEREGAFVVAWVIAW